MCIRQLRNILNLDILTFVWRGRIRLNQRKHFLIQTCGRYFCRTILIYITGFFKHLQDTLLGQCRSKYNRKIHKGSKTWTNSFFKRFLHFHRFILHQIPFIYHDNQSFLILLNQGEDIQVLTFDSSRGIQHQNTYIRTFNGTNRTDHRVVFQILIHLILLTDTGGIHQIKIKSELIVAGIDRITSRSGNLGHNVTVFTDKCIYNRRFTGIRTSHHCKTRYLIIQDFRGFLLELTDNQVH